MLCNVQRKISCVFEAIIVNQNSTKRNYQSYKVLAGDKIKESARKADIESSVATEKIDGTCCYIAEYKGKPWLWARLDIKPNKAGMKKLKQKKRSTSRTGSDDTPGSSWHADDIIDTIVWDLEKDFKTKPDDWIVASGVQLVDGVPQPDDNGHIPGWVPVDTSSRQHCWHLSAVDLNKGFALVLQHVDGQLEIVTRDMAQLTGCTMELIGTNVNGNPYKIGSKDAPVHILVRHGSIPVGNLPSFDRCRLKDWFVSSDDGLVEGIVWHCSGGEMFKLHRHHLELSWPIDRPKLCMLPVTIRLHHTDDEPNTMSKLLYNLNNNTYSSLTEISQ